MLLYWSLPERCLYEILVFLRHSPTILSSLGLFSNYMCFKSQKDFPSSQKLPKEDQVGETGTGATALPSPHIGRAGNECQRGSSATFFPPFTLSCNFADLLSYPWAGFVLLGSTTEGDTGFRESWYWSLIWNLILNMIWYLTWQRGNKNQRCLGIWDVVSGYQGCSPHPACLR